MFASAKCYAFRQNEGHDVSAPRIKKLPPLLVNQIAAGEVIERPASVVKELLENSIDAGATDIEIDVESGGKQLLRIRDNGCGIAKADLALAVSSHATSKIASVDDLSCIASLGFRGEALASIASIAHFKILSNVAEQEQAWGLTMDGRGSDVQCQPVAHSTGTTIEVRDLFFNTPARRRFLRTHKTELGHIEEVVKRIALSHFEVAIHLRNEGKTVFRLPAGDTKLNQEKRIAKLFGQAFLQQVLVVDTDITGLQLRGWISTVDYSRNSNDQQYFYINGRMVKDRLLAHALRQAYQDKLYPGKQASYVLYLTIDAQEVDVNVHPTKHEVRFQDSRLVHDFIFQSVAKCLSGQVANNEPVVDRMVREPTPHYQTSAFVPSQLSSKKPRSLANELPANSLGVYQSRYLLIEDLDALVLVSITKAWQHLLNNLWLQHYQEATLKTKPLLLPITIDVSEMKSQYFDSLQSLGILCEALSDNTIIVREVPVFLSALNVELALQQLFMRNNESTDAVTLMQQLLTEAAINLHYCAQAEAISQLHAYLRQLTTIDYQQLSYRLTLDTLTQHFQS